MKISKKMADAFNDQIQAEFQSAYLYLSMAAWFEEESFGGFAHWMRKQYEEELEHAMKMFDYVVERGGRVELKAIEVPQKDWADAKTAFQDTYDHEQKVTSLIYKLVDMAIKEKDHASTEFLSWFVKEQVEEEATASGILAKLEMAGGATPPLLALEHQLGTR